MSITPDPPIFQKPQVPAQEVKISPSGYGPLARSCQVCHAFPSANTLRYETNRRGNEEAPTTATVRGNAAV